MLDFAAVLTTSGLLIWQHTSHDEADALANLSAETLLDGSTCEVGPSRLEWLQTTDGRLAFLIATPRVLPFPQSSQLLKAFRAEFIASHGPLLESMAGLTQGDRSPTVYAVVGPSGWEDALARWDIAFLDLVASFDNFQSTIDSSTAEPLLTGDGATADPTVADDEEIARNINALRNRRGKTVARGGGRAVSSGRDSPSGRKKRARRWDNSTADQDDDGQLDYSSSTPISRPSTPSLAYDRTSVGKRGATGLYEVADYDDASAPSTSSSRVGKLFSRMTDSIGLSSRIITKDNLDTPLNSMKDLLMSKNVAHDTAVELCQSIGEQLTGQKVAGLDGGVSKAVERAMDAALTARLTPKTSNDIIADAKRKGRTTSKRPYVIVFVGVNGVGKSTNLSKVAFWLLQNRLRVLIAACDTFRSGAVEQLRTHVRNLGQLEIDASVPVPFVDLYDQGYGKDAAGIAKNAIEHASEAGFDVVLIDTAGRMQDNEPLMRALAKLVNVNNPDKVLFVGEALVGNEAVDQLGRFDKSLRSFSGMGGKSRGIDGIILTKFDTIDDKVGAAVSMACTTGCPVVFIGTGQTYSDLRTLRVSSIVTALLN